MSHTPLTTHPLGRFVGRDLVMTRTFNAPIDDVWASITEPERVARWYGHWEGTATVGATIQVSLPAEDYETPQPYTIAACEPPRHLRLHMGEPGPVWDVEINLREHRGVTTLEFIHHLPPGTTLDQVAPGWDFYLDRLTASRNDEPLPVFDGYLEVLAPRYSELQAASDATPADGC